jgi:hypothetical protein
MQICMEPSHPLFTLGVELRNKATRRYPDLRPLRSQKKFSKCYSIIMSHLAFWFEDPSGCSHIEKAKIPTTTLEEVARV